MLIYAVIAITSALLFYTIAVFSERLQGTLKLWHLGVFQLGLICDMTGTLLMENISRNSVAVTSTPNLHGLTGLIAIALMFIHVIWASVVLFKNNEVAKSKFHKFSIIVWIIWLIPFISGAVAHMN
ncbi:MAG: HsmA family protein [Clostridium sp.]|uniref:HsmA family protein n=1 Tax=Clostridium sp. TaxID=1506 RepID=UPI003D6C9CDB